MNASPNEDSNTRSDVVIVGGGLAGVATAIGLRKAGVTVTLLEQAETFEEIGAGVNVGPNATRVLAAWGLLDEVFSLGFQPKNWVIRDATTGKELTRQNVSSEFEHRYGAQATIIHRGDLLTVLLRVARELGAELLSSQRVVEVEIEEDRAVAITSTGARFSGHIVVAADGIHSTLRSVIVEDDAIPEGYVAYRGTVLTSNIDFDVDLENLTLWIAPGVHLIQYPIRQDSSDDAKLVNHVAVFKSEKFTRNEEGWGSPEEMDRAFADCMEPIRRALHHVPRDHNWVMYDREPIDNWVKGRLVLLGDAAHPMLQYLGQGACQAIQDAYHLQNCILDHVVEGHRGQWDAALAAFNDQRAPQAGRVQRAARTWGDITHADGLERLLRDELLARRDPHDFRYIDWLYSDPMPTA